MASCSCKSKSKRWTFIAVLYILDVCRINAATIVALNKGKDPRQEIFYDLGMKLSLPLVQPYVEKSLLFDRLAV